MNSAYSVLVNNNTSVGLFNAVGLPRLAMYWPRVLGAAVGFEAFFQLFALISPYLFPTTWTRMNKAERYKWCVRKSSSLHAIYMVTKALVIIADTSLRKISIHGTSLYAESAYAISLGYFLWDIFNTYSNLELNGWGYVVHAVASFSAYLFSFTPLLQYYGACFMMFEVSTLFLNIHLTFEDCSLNDYIMYYINGMALVSSFFFARVIYGTILSINVWRELANSAVPISAFAANTIRLANLVLMGLSYYWFSIVIMTAKRNALDADLIRALDADLIRALEDMDNKDIKAE